MEDTKTDPTVTDTTDAENGPAQDADIAAVDDQTDWKAEARKWEQRAKSNKDAADELATIRESQKTEAEKVADRLAEAEAKAAEIPAKVSESLKAHLVRLHEINDEDAELFLTATDPEVLLKQAERFTARNKSTGYVPTQGTAAPSGAQVSAFELGAERAKARYQKN